MDGDEYNKFVVDVLNDVGCRDDWVGVVIYDWNGNTVRKVERSL